MVRKPSAAVPARSVSARIDMDTEKAMAASPAETQSTVSSAPPFWEARARLGEVFIRQIQKRTIGAQRGGYGHYRQPRGVRRGRDHFDANSRRHIGLIP